MFFISSFQNNSRTNITLCLFYALSPLAHGSRKIHQKSIELIFSSKQFIEIIREVVKSLADTEERLFSLPLRLVKIAEQKEQPKPLNL